MRLGVRLGVAAILITMTAGCAAITAGMARSAGWSGWFQIHRTAEPARRAKKAYMNHFERRPIGLIEPPCGELRSKVERPSGPVYVLVHGVNGDGTEFHSLPGILGRGEPAAMFMYRWVAYDNRDNIVTAFITGMNRLLACLPAEAGPVIVLAHSAGGVVVSEAVSRLAVPASSRESLRVFTIASPLAGTRSRPPNFDGRAEARFLLDLGKAIPGYAAAAARVRVVHLRTLPPGDSVMTPTKKGHIPNDPSIGVPGAPQLDLPADLGHLDALVWVAERIVEDGGTRWLDGEAAPAETSVEPPSSAPASAPTLRPAP